MASVEPSWIRPLTVIIRSHPRTRSRTGKPARSLNRAILVGAHALGSHGTLAGPPVGATHANLHPGGRTLEFGLRRHDTVIAVGKTHRFRVFKFKGTVPSIAR